MCSCISAHVWAPHGVPMHPHMDPLFAAPKLDLHRSKPNLLSAERVLVGGVVLASGRQQGATRREQCMCASMLTVLDHLTRDFVQVGAQG